MALACLKIAEFRATELIVTQSVFSLLFFPVVSLNSELNFFNPSQALCGFAKTR